MIAFAAVTWLLDQIVREGKLIGQLPISFLILCALVLALAYLVVRWQSQEKFKEANALIGLYKERISLQPVDNEKTSSLEAEISRLKSENESLTARLRPSLDVLFGKQEPFVQTHTTQRGEQITHYGIQIHNSGATTAKRVRVQIEGFRHSGVIRNIRFFDPSRMRQDVSLDPGEKKAIQFVQTAADGLAYLIEFAGTKPLDLGQHHLTIRVLAEDLPVREVKAVLEIKEDRVVELRPAKTSVSFRFSEN